MTDPEPSIIPEIAEKTLVLRINRPEKNNIMNYEIRDELWRQLRKYEDSLDIKCVIITAVGKNFSVGADIKNLLSLTKDNVKEYTTFVREFLNYIYGYPKITIGAVNGLAVGGGLELLLTLDLVIAGETSRFGQTELNVGIIPGGGGTQRLQKIIGERKTKEMIYTGRLMNAQEALSLGLLNNVVPDETVLDEAIKLSGKISEKSLSSLSLAKKAINFDDNLNGLEMESNLYSEILLSKDAKEGLNAFLEKRKPMYSN
ncbi:MAG: enoyl-CoA hydratase/isomerase family protein [Thermoplasmatales archaeon]|jgi:enoyl-CoA hydratase|nr:enoyl-CoA hydratase/isomerase family protein [Thermoplasmatales archaeon]